MPSNAKIELILVLTHMVRRSDWQKWAYNCVAEAKVQPAGFWGFAAFAAFEAFESNHVNDETARFICIH